MGRGETQTHLGRGQVTAQAEAGGHRGLRAAPGAQSRQALGGSPPCRPHFGSWPLRGLGLGRLKHTWFLFRMKCPKADVLSTGGWTVRSRCAPDAASCAACSSDPNQAFFKHRKAPGLPATIPTAVAPVRDAGQAGGETLPGPAWPCRPDLWVPVSPVFLLLPLGPDGACRHPDCPNPPTPVSVTL